MTLEEMWDCLNVEHGVSEQTLQVVTNINGYNEDTMRIYPIRSLLIVGGFALFLVTWLDLLSIPPCATDTLFRLLELTYVWLIYPGYILYALDHHPKHRSGHVLHS